MPMNKVLLDAAALVRKGWTTHTYARDKAGAGVGPINPRAVCWCAMGAIKLAAINVEGVESAVAALRARIGTGIPNWNDDPGQTAENVAQIMEQAAHAE